MPQRDGLACKWSQERILEDFIIIACSCQCYTLLSLGTVDIIVLLFFREYLTKLNLITDFVFVKCAKPNFKMADPSLIFFYSYIIFRTDYIIKFMLELRHKFRMTNFSR
jgi:hypothetical protein